MLHRCTMYDVIAVKRYDVIDRQSHNRSCLLSHAGFSFLPTTTTTTAAATAATTTAAAAATDRR